MEKCGTSRPDYSRDGLLGRDAPAFERMTLGLRLTQLGWLTCCFSFLERKSRIEIASIQSKIEPIDKRSASPDVRSGNRDYYNETEGGRDWQHCDAEIAVTLPV